MEVPEFLEEVEAFLKTLEANDFAKFTFGKQIASLRKKLGKVQDAPRGGPQVDVAAVKTLLNQIIGLASQAEHVVQGGKVADATKRPRAKSVDAAVVNGGVVGRAARGK